MVLGAFAAIGQTNIKRLMAYSSIGHMGYALVGLAAGTAEGVQGVLVYMAIYLAMTLGAFACILAMRRDGKAVEDIGDLAGLSRTNPLHGLRARDDDVLAGRHSAAGRLLRQVLRLPRRDQGRALHARRHRRASPAWSAPITICASSRSCISTSRRPGFDPMRDGTAHGAGGRGPLQLFFFVYPGPLVSVATSAAKSLF